MACACAPNMSETVAANTILRIVASLMFVM